MSSSLPAALAAGSFISASAVARICNVPVVRLLREVQAGKLAVAGRCGESANAPVLFSVRDVKAAREHFAKK